jgi:uncharacterized protein
VKILIDIGHPAHVHLYKNFYKEMAERGHEITITVKDVPSAIQLLNIYKIPFIYLGRKGDSIFEKFLRQILYDIYLLRIAKRNKIDIGLGSSITLAHVSKLSHIKSIIFDDDDDEVQPLMAKLGHPFADYLLTPDALKGRRKKRDTIYYPGYHELAYLHPDNFIPDKSVLKEAGLREGEVFFVLRFNSFKAHHDIGVRGLSLENKLILVKMLIPYGKVFITTEREIEPELQEYQIRISPDKIHSLLSFATLFIGDSQTMSSEAAVLGIPSLRCNSFAGRIASLEEEEKKYQLTFAFHPDNFAGLQDKIRELLSIPDLKDEWQRRRKIMLEDKIDVTKFMISFIENLP